MKKRTKQIVLLIIIVLVLNLVTYGLLLGYKYLNHKKLIGEYELVDQNLDDTEYKLKVSIYKWAKGEEKNLKCDLWNCIGYDFGTYSIKNNMITVYLNANTIFNNNSVGIMYYKYKIKVEGNNVYLILSEGNQEYKYKKINSN
mgnify:CR=1 FL=1